MNILAPSIAQREKLKDHLKNILLQATDSVEEHQRVPYDYYTKQSPFRGKYVLLKEIADSGLSITQPDFYERFNQLGLYSVPLTEHELIQYIIYYISFRRSYDIRSSFVDKVYNYFGIESKQVNDSISSVMKSVSQKIIQTLQESKYRLHPAFSLKGGKLLLLHLSDLRKEYQTLKLKDDERLDRHSLELKNKIQYLEPIINDWLQETSDSDFDAGMALLEIATPQQFITTSALEFVLENQRQHSPNNIILYYLFSDDNEIKFSTIQIDSWLRDIPSGEPIFDTIKNILDDIVLTSSTGYEVQYVESVGYNAHVLECLERIHKDVQEKRYVHPITKESYNPYRNHLCYKEIQANILELIPNLFPEESAKKEYAYQFLLHVLAYKKAPRARIWQVYYHYQVFCKWYYLFSLIGRYLLDHANPKPWMIEFHREIRSRLVRGYALYMNRLHPNRSVEELIYHFSERYRFIFERQQPSEYANMESTPTETDYRSTVYFNESYHSIPYDMGKIFEASFTEIAGWKRAASQQIELVFEINIPVLDKNNQVHGAKDCGSLQETLCSNRYEYFYQLNSFILKTILENMVSQLPILYKELSTPFQLINNNESTQFTLSTVLNRLLSIYKDDKDVFPRLQSFYTTQVDFCKKFVFAPSDTFHYQIRELEQDSGNAYPHSLRPDDFNTIMTTIQAYEPLKELKGMVLMIHERTHPDLYTIFRIMFKYDVIYRQTRYTCNSPMKNQLVSSVVQGISIDNLVDPPIRSLPYSPFDSELIDITFHNSENHTDYHLYHQSIQHPTRPPYLPLAGVFFDYMNMFGSLRNSIDKIKKRCDRLYHSLAIFLSYDKNVLLEVQYLSNANSIVFNPLLVNQCLGVSTLASENINQLLTTQLTNPMLEEEVFQMFIKEPTDRELLPLFETPLPWTTLSMQKKIEYKKVIDDLSSYPIKAKLTYLVFNSVQHQTNTPYGESITYQLYTFLNQTETDNFHFIIKGGTMWRQYIREKLNQSLPETKELIEDTKTISDCDVMIVPRPTFNGQPLLPYSGDMNYEDQVQFAMYSSFFDSLMISLPYLVKNIKSLRPDASVFTDLAKSMAETYSVIEPCTVEISYHDVQEDPRISYSYLKNDVLQPFDASTDKFADYFQKNDKPIASLLKKLFRHTNLSAKFIIVDSEDSYFYLFRLMGMVRIRFLRKNFTEIKSGIYYYELLDVSSDRDERGHPHSSWKSSLGINMVDIDWFMKDNFTIFNERKFTKPEKRCARYQQLMKIVCQLNLYDQTRYADKKGLDILAPYAETKKQFLANLESCLGSECNKLFSDLIILFSGHEEDKINIINRWKLYCSCLQPDRMVPNIYEYNRVELEWFQSYIQSLAIETVVKGRYLHVIQLSLIPDTNQSLLDLTFIKGLWEDIQTLDPAKRVTANSQFQRMVQHYLDVQEYFQFNDPRGVSSYYKTEMFSKYEDATTKYIYLDDTKYYWNESLNDTMLSIVRSLQQLLPKNPASIFDTSFVIHNMIPNEDYSAVPLSINDPTLSKEKLQKIWNYVVMKEKGSFPKSMYDNYLESYYIHSTSNLQQLEEIIHMINKESFLLPEDNEWVWMNKESLYGSSVALIGQLEYQNKIVPSNSNNALFYTYLNYSYTDRGVLFPSYSYDVLPYANNRRSVQFSTLLSLISEPIEMKWLRGTWMSYGYFRNQFSHEVVKQQISVIHFLHSSSIQRLSSLFLSDYQTIISNLPISLEPMSNILSIQTPTSRFLNRAVQLDYYVSLDPSQVTERERRALEDNLSTTFPAIHNVLEYWTRLVSQRKENFSTTQLSRLFQVVWWMNQVIPHKSWVSQSVIHILSLALISMDNVYVKEFQRFVPFSPTQVYASLYMLIQALLPKGARYNISYLYQLLDQVFILDETTHRVMSYHLQEVEVKITQLLYHPHIIASLDHLIQSIQKETKSYLKYRKRDVTQYIANKPLHQLIWTDDRVIKAYSANTDVLYSVIQRKIEKQRLETYPPTFKNQDKPRRSILRPADVEMEIAYRKVQPILIYNFKTANGVIPIYAVDRLESLPSLESLQPDTVFYTQAADPTKLFFLFGEGNALTPEVKQQIQSAGFPLPSELKFQ